MGGVSCFWLREGLSERFVNDGRNLPIRQGLGYSLPIPIFLLDCFRVLATTGSQLYGSMLTKRFGQTRVFHQSSDASST